MPYKDREAAIASCREYYRRNHDKCKRMMERYRAEHKAQMKAYMNARYRQFADNLQILKRATGCAVCGRRDGKLDYHHVDKQSKRYHVASMHNCSLEAFIDEVGKCIVLCSSCHARHHRMEQLGRPSALDALPYFCESRREVTSWTTS